MLVTPHYVKDEALMERVQHQLTRLFPSLHCLNYSERLRRFHLWFLEERRHRADFIVVYKLLHGLTRVSPDALFTLANDSNTRGHPYKLVKQYRNKDTLSHFFIEQVVNTWKSSSHEAVLATTLISFKHHLEAVRNTTQIGLFQDDFCLTPNAALLG
jgi:hypothetical protein